MFAVITYLLNTREIPNPKHPSRDARYLQIVSGKKLPGAVAPDPSNVSTPNADASISAESINWGDASVTVGSDVVFSFDDNEE